MCTDDGCEETVMDVLTLTKDSQRIELWSAKTLVASSDGRFLKVIFMIQPAKDWARHDAQVLWHTMPVFLSWYQQ
jgi:hypothetical protein